MPDLDFEVNLGSGTAGSVWLSCSSCGLDFLTNSGEWDPVPEDQPDHMPAGDLITKITEHICP